MTSRSFAGSGLLGTADTILQLRANLADAAIEWVLAEREVAPAQARFDAACAELPFAHLDRAVGLAIDTDAVARYGGTDPGRQRAGRAAGAFIDASKREHDATQRWQDCARRLVEALERNPTP